MNSGKLNVDVFREGRRGGWAWLGLHHFSIGLVNAREKKEGVEESMKGRRRRTPGAFIHLP